MEESDRDQDKTIAFDYIKSNYFRVLHVTGAHGSVNPATEEISMGVFNERPPLNQREEFRIEDGRLAERTQIVRRDVNIVREVEACMILDRGAAESLREWLSQAISKLDEIVKQKETQSE